MPILIDYYNVNNDIEASAHKLKTKSYTRHIV